ncbi:MAG: hypothetical protein FRX49_05378 [Trebouxia sp. A1-2]|nr:MAG: hypothetical protein FRX49_05378 [Trebouxia sp. A1-2]
MLHLFLDLAQQWLQQQLHTGLRSSPGSSVADERSLIGDRRQGSGGHKACQLLDGMQLQKGCRVRGSRGGVALHCSMITARLRGLQVAQNAKHPGQQLFHPFFRVQGERARTTLQRERRWKLYKIQYTRYQLPDTEVHSPRTLCSAASTGPLSALSGLGAKPVSSSGRTQMAKHTWNRVCTSGSTRSGAMKAIWEKAEHAATAKDDLSHSALSLCGHMLSATGHCTIAADSSCAIADVALWWGRLLRQAFVQGRFATARSGKPWVATGMRAAEGGGQSIDDDLASSGGYIDMNKVREYCAGGLPTLGVMLGYLSKHEHPLAPPKLVVGIRFPQHHPVSNPVIPTVLPLGQAVSGQKQG